MHFFSQVYVDTYVMQVRGNVCCICFYVLKPFTFSATEQYVARIKGCMERALLFVFSPECNTIVPLSLSVGALQGVLGPSSSQSSFLFRLPSDFAKHENFNDVV